MNGVFLASRPDPSLLGSQEGGYKPTWRVAQAAPLCTCSNSRLLEYRVYPGDGLTLPTQHSVSKVTVTQKIH